MDDYSLVIMHHLFNYSPRISLDYNLHPPHSSFHPISLFPVSIPRPFNNYFRAYNGNTFYNNLVFNFIYNNL